MHAEFLLCMVHLTLALEATHGSVQISGRLVLFCWGPRSKTKCVRLKTSLLLEKINFFFFFLNPKEITTIFFDKLSFKHRQKMIFLLLSLSISNVASPKGTHSVAYYDRDRYKVKGYVVVLSLTVVLTELLSLQPIMTGRNVR